MAVDAVALQRFLEVRDTVRARLGQSQSGSTRASSRAADLSQTDSSASGASAQMQSSVSGAGSVDYADRIAQLVRSAQNNGKTVRNLGNFLDIRA